MKIALQEGLLPGSTLDEKLDFAESLSVEGLEVSGRGPARRIEELESALRNRGIRLVSLCGQGTFDFLDPDADKRNHSIAEAKENLQVCGHFGAVGLILPPIFGPPRLPDLTPLADAVTLEMQLLTEIVRDLAAFAAEQQTKVLLEPLNRYEEHLLRQQERGIEVIQRAGDPSSASLLCDFFHMHIEETDTPATLRRIGRRYVGHVHMADNTRQEPGSGDIDWHAGLSALRDIGFDGYLAYECGISGENEAERRKALERSVQFIQGIIADLA